MKADPSLSRMPMWLRRPARYAPEFAACTLRFRRTLCICTNPTRAHGAAVLGVHLLLLGVPSLEQQKELFFVLESIAKERWFGA